jgi:hypothetical protein
MYVLASLLVLVGLCFAPDVVGPRLISWRRQRRARQRAEWAWRAAEVRRMLGQG